MSKRRPSPAMIIAMIALCLGLGGSAIAASDLSKSQVKKIAKKQAKKQIRKKAPGLHVAHAATAGNAATATEASRLNGLGASSLVRSASSAIDNNALVGPSVEAPIRSTTIVTPTSGFLLINAGSDVFGGPDFGTCGIEVNGVDIDSSDRSWQLGAGNTEEDCTTETTVPVGAGTQSVVFESLEALAAGARYDEAELQVLFVPFGSTGAQPRSTAKGSSGAHQVGN